MRITTVIVDDEPLARRRLKSLLGTDNEIQLIAECNDGPSAVSTLRELKPDLAFLDIQMPGMDGFEVLRRIAAFGSPLVIFVTAFDQYALRAFEAHALDYLLKPFKRARFFEALRRAKDQLRSRNTHQAETISDLLQQLDAGRDRIAIRCEGKVVVLNAEEIEWIEAALNYVRIRAGKQTYTVREGISSFAKKLMTDKFLRIHRSIIVNASRIRRLEPCNGAEYIVVLDDGKELPLGRNYRQSVESFFRLT